MSTGMSCFLPYQLTNLSKCILRTWPIFAVHKNHETTIGYPKWKPCRPVHAISPAMHNTMCTPVSLPFRDRHKPFHRNLETATLHRLEYIHHWLCDRIFDLLLHLDQSSMVTCSLQLLCPGSFSPIQSVSNCSWHQDQNYGVKVCLRNCLKFDPNLPAIKPNSSHHSIHRNSSHHHTKNCSLKKVSVGIRLCKFLSF